MTLIISCITKEFVVQASDRRVSFQGRDAGDDQANKAIFYCGQSAWAYTGLAKMRRKRTDEWMVDILFQHDKLQDAMRALASEADAAVRLARVPRPLASLAVVGVGFANFPNVGHQPYLGWVSNFLDPPSNPRRQLRPEFACFTALIPDGSPFELAFYGQHVDQRRRQALERSVREVVQRDGRPISVARLLIELIQEISKSNKTVGPNVMCTFLTRDGITPGDPSIRSQPIPLDPAAPQADRFRMFSDYDGKPTCVYVPGQPEALLFHGPVSVCKDVSISAGMFGPTDAVAPFLNQGPFPDYSMTLLK